MSDMFEGIERGLEEALAYEKGEIELKTSLRNNDLISREALAQELTVEMVKCIRMSEETKGTMAERVLNRVLEAPAVDAVEVVHAVWDFVGENSTGKIFLCSACGFPHNPNQKDVGLGRVKEKPNYCPNCIARMDLEE